MNNDFLCQLLSDPTVYTLPLPDPMIISSVQEDVVLNITEDFMSFDLEATINGCSSGFFLDPETENCTSSPDKCASCLNFSYCFECKQSFRFRTTCVSTLYRV